MKVHTTIALLLLFSFSTPALHADVFHPLVRHYDKQQYGGGPQNWDIAQGASGCMYFANNYGVLEFDSENWVLHRTQDWSEVRALYYAPWDSTLCFGASNQFRRFRADPGTDLREESFEELLKPYDVSEIWKIRGFRDEIFFMDENTLYKIGEHGVKKFNFNARVKTFEVVGSELYVYTAADGLLRLDDEVFRPAPGAEQFETEKICALIRWEESCLIVTENDGLFRYDGTGISPFKTVFDRELAGESIICAAVKNGIIALGTVSSGVWIIGGESVGDHHLDLSSGLSNNTVLSLFFDREDNLWLGLDNGIDCILLTSPERPLFSDREAFGAGYSSIIYASALWLGTNQGLFRIDWDDSRDKTRKIIPVEAVKGQVWHLEAIEGSLYCCTDKGLYILTGSTASARFLPMNGVWKVEKLRKHPSAIIGSTYDNLFLLRRQADGHYDFAGFIAGFDGSGRAFEEDGDGCIWISDWKRGLFRLTFDNSLSRFSKVENLSSGHGFPTTRNNIPNQTSAGILFTTEKGFYRFDEMRSLAVPAETMKGRFDDGSPAVRLVELPGGVRWFSSGLVQAVEYPDGSGGTLLDTLSLQYLCSKRKLGFDQILPLSDSRFLINTEDGFSEISLDRLQERRGRNEPAVFVKKIYLTGRQQDSLLFAWRGPAGGQTVLRLRHGQNSLRFEFVQPRYARETETRYSYILENYDTDWSPYGKMNFKEYTGLPPGNYLFRVRTFGSESGDGPAVSIVLSPPWYRSRTAYLVYTLMLILLVYGAFALLNGLLSRRTRRLILRAEEELRREQMQRDLEGKANDLAASTMDVIRKNEILRKIYAALDKVSDYLESSHERENGKRLLVDLRSDIRENISQDDTWKRFETNFDLVYSDFLKRLGRQCPQLSLNDRKICVYLRMGLRSKEIAPLLNMTVRSVEMTRYRIRKKLGLGREENLQEFLDNFQQDNT